MQKGREFNDRHFDQSRLRSGQPPKDGGARNGTPMYKKYLSKMLRNPIYVGEIRRKGTSYARQHEPIISRQLWGHVRVRIQQRSPSRRGCTGPSSTTTCSWRSSRPTLWMRPSREPCRER